MTAVLAACGLPHPASAATLIDLAIEPADISILGEAVSDNLGTWTLATGDVNGDGFQDLLAVACNSHPLEGTRTGTLYIFWGDVLGQEDTLDLATDPPGVSRIFGKPGGDYLACNVASGDFNRDGYDDIIWGQPLTSNFDTWSGKVYVVFGSSAFPDTLDLYTNPPGVVTVYGTRQYEILGRTACACDVDGDDYDDIVLTAPGLEYTEVFVIRGRGAFPPVFSTAQTEPGMFRIIDDTPNANMQGIACADVNGDGADDLVLGAIDADPERLVLVYGSPSLSVADSLLLANPPVPIKVILGEYSHGGLGISLAFGDLDDDARLDLVAGAYHADPLGCYDCGEVYVLYNADALPDTVNLGNTSVPMTRVVGFGSSTKYGADVFCADLSGDSIDDLLLSSYPLYVRATTTFIPGRSYMPATILLATETESITRIKEAIQGDELGEGMTAIDFNSDGLKDLILSAHHASLPGRNYAGILYGFNNTSIVTAVGHNRPPAFVLKNYPNPFANQTCFVFGGLPQGTNELFVYDVAGRRVFQTAVQGHRGGGFEVVWDGRDLQGRKLPNGVYFCRVTVGFVSETRKLAIVR